MLRWNSRKNEGNVADQTPEGKSKQESVVSTETQPLATQTLVLENQRCKKGQTYYLIAQNEKKPTSSIFK